MKINNKNSHLLWFLITKKSFSSVLICCGLATLVSAIFWQTTRHEFLLLDDHWLLLNVPEETNGLTLRGVIWDFTQTTIDRWTPLSALSRQIDCQFYGLQPGLHHLTNVIIHAATSVLCFFALRALTNSIWRSAFVASVFAIHPMHVQPVAWITGRNELLSALFFMFTLLAYNSYARKRWSICRYGIVALCFLFALMSKPTLVIAPIILLFLDYWPLNRFENTSSITKLLLEKLPLLLLAGFTAFVTAKHEPDFFTAPLSFYQHRLGWAPVGLFLYLEKFIYPVKLAFYYPMPVLGWPIIMVATTSVIIVAITICSLLFRKRHPYFLMGWGWNCTFLLLPFGGIIFSQDVQTFGDRYSYLSQIGLSIAVVWFCGDLVRRKFKIKVFVTTLGLISLGILLGISYRETSYWRNTITLMERNLECTDNENGFAHSFLGEALLQQGCPEKAVQHFQKLVELYPRNGLNHQSLAVALIDSGKKEEGVSEFEKSLPLIPDNPVLWNNLSWMISSSSALSSRYSNLALNLSMKANDTTRGGNPEILETLAAAQALSGNHEVALVTAKKALEMAQKAGNKELVLSLKRGILLYGAGKPLSESK